MTSVTEQTSFLQKKFKLAKQLYLKLHTGVNTTLAITKLILFYSLFSLLLFSQEHINVTIWIYLYVLCKYFPQNL